VKSIDGARGEETDAPEAKEGERQFRFSREQENPFSLRKRKERQGRRREGWTNSRTEEENREGGCRSESGGQPVQGPRQGNGGKEARRAYAAVAREGGTTV